MTDDRRDRTICFVNGMRTYAGAEVWMLEAAQGLRSRGHSVEFVTHPDSRLQQLAYADGFTVTGIPIRLDAAPWTLFSMWRYLRRSHPHAIVCNRIKDLKIAGVAAKLVGVPVILHSRESDTPLRGGRPFYRWYFNSIASGILVNSEATLRTTCESAPWLAPERIHLLLKGVDVRRFATGPQPAGPPTVGFAGRLSLRKGLTTLQTAWEHLRSGPSAVPALRLRIAGTGEMMPLLESWRLQLDHPDEVELLGTVDDMPSFYRSLDVLAVPSVFEGYGLAAAEALACERPVVASRVSSLPEIISDGQTGRLVPVGDASALAAALREIITQPELARRWGRAGRLEMAARHDRELTLDRFERLLALQDREPPKGTT